MRFLMWGKIKEDKKRPKKLFLEVDQLIVDDGKLEELKEKKNG